jgi:Superfamily I DNA and RNA helicases
MMEYEAFRSRFGLLLDGQQEAAVRQTEGPVLLLAVPGSGKTTVLLARIGCLIFCQDADPRSILTMTYTVAATEEMRRRFAGIFGGEIAAALDFRTINGVCARIIRQYEAQSGRSAFRLITEEGTSARLLREAYRRCMLPYPAESELEEIKTRIAFCKNGMLTDEEIRELDRENGNLFPIYDAYRAILRENRLMDYDDQMVYGLAILRRAPEILSAWRRRYRYFCVDEAQDTSKIQHEIIRLLAGESRNLFMVGDEDQTIYGFRAAYPRALTEFRLSWPEGRILLLETNYRSDAQIVDHADRFIQKTRNVTKSICILRILPARLSA